MRRTITSRQGHYANLCGLDMYYEIHGAGEPILLLHGGGSTIETSFGAVLPLFARTRQVIAVELQAHGHTSDRGAAVSFRQDADDVAELLHQLAIPQTDILGFSNGGQTGMEFALRYPEKLRKLIIASAFYSRAGAPDQFWPGFDNPKFSDMPQIYKDEFLKITNDSDALTTMFRKDAERMRTFEGWTPAQLQSIAHPTLIVSGDQDLVPPEHVVEMHRLIPNSRLAILPANHGSYMGEAMSRNQTSELPKLFAAMIEEFLAA